MTILGYILCILSLLWAKVCLGVTPSGEMSSRKLIGSATTIYVAPGGFGSPLDSETEAATRRLVKPDQGEDGCAPVVPTLRSSMGFYLLVSRGNCSFLEKAIAAAEVGASGVVIYNSLEGIYQGRDYASETDYECDNGSGYIPTVTSPVYSDEMSALMPDSCTKDSNCDSGRCVVTNTTSEKGTLVCCAWDLYITMGTSSSEDDYYSPSIPAVFIRMEDADTLTALPELDRQTLEVMLYSRPTTFVDFAAILIWMCAVFTIAYGATKAAEDDAKYQMGLKGNYMRVGGGGGMESDNESVMSSGGGYQGYPGYAPFPSAEDDRVRRGLADSGNNGSSGGGGGATLQASASAGNNSNNSSSNNNNNNNSGVITAVDIIANMSARLRAKKPAGEASDSNTNKTGGLKPKRKESSGNGSGSSSDEYDGMEIGPYHAVGFVFVSSCFLILLYFVNLYFFVSILYLAAAAFATGKVFFYPLFKQCSRTYHAIRLGVEVDEIQEYISLADTSREICGININASKIAAGTVSILLSLTWFFFQKTSWVWILQDFLGMSVCVMFLMTVRLPNLQAATTLLGLAFFYDVFFVFISPYFFNSSVMVTVASGPAVDYHNDENWCEKYPSDDACASTTLPMLLAVPTFSSFESSESMLGLGDIVLPGLLLAWTARLDIRTYGTLSSPYASKGYFPMTLFGYAVGLMAANFAVEYFETGQPALLYIVPLTLGPVLLRAFNTGQLPYLWKGLPPMKMVAQPMGFDEREALLSGRMNATPAEASWTEKIAQISANDISYDSLEGQGQGHGQGGSPIQGSYQHSGGSGSGGWSPSTGVAGAGAGGAPVSISSLGSHGRTVLNSTSRSHEQLI